MLRGRALPERGMKIVRNIDRGSDTHAIIMSLSVLRRRAAAEHTSIRSLVTCAIETRFRPQPSRPVTGPLVGKPGKKRRPAPGSPDRENPYDVLFA